MNMKTIILFVPLFMLFTLSTFADPKPHPGYYKCRNNPRRLPAKLNGKEICVLKVNCFYGTLAQKEKARVSGNDNDKEGWQEDTAVCDMENCNDPLKCVRTKDYNSQRNQIVYGSQPPGTAEAAEAPVEGVREH